jgi:hypothetical protein
MKINRTYKGKDIRKMKRKDLLAVVEDFLNMFAIEIDLSYIPNEYKPLEEEIKK